MIKKFDIQNFGSYKNYKWSKLLCNEKGYFDKVNVIYGRNYSGKTTLSRMLRTIENKELHEDYKDAIFNIDTYTTPSCFNEKNLNQTHYQEEVFVYNTDFVKENLKWLVTDEGKISSFAILGKENVELKEKIKEIKEKLDSEKISFLKMEEDYRNKENVVNTLNFEMNSLLTNQARNIRVEPQFYGEPNYNRTHLEKELSTARTEILNEDEIFQYKSRLKENKKPTIEISKSINIDLINSFDITVINTLLSKKIKLSETIVELVENNILEEWIKIGYEIHKDKESHCKFCDGPLEDDLYTKIENHFSTESKQLMSSIDKKVKELEILKEREIENLRNKHFYIEFQGRVDELAFNMEEVIEEQKKWINEVIDHLKSRRKSIFTPLAPVEQYTGRVNDDNKKAYQIIVDEHNNKHNNLNQEHKRIKKLLKENKVAEIKRDTEYGLKKIAIDTETKELQKLKDIYNSKKTARIEETALHDEYVGQLSAEENTKTLINQYLKVFFSRNQITIQFHQNGSERLFKIMRGSQLAHNLSEGERRIISFCYYLAKISDSLKKKESKEKLILYIDDPISSLDNNHVFTVFSLIDDLIIRQGNYKQLFVSTHSLEFLRYLRRLNINVKEKEEVKYYFIEREIREKDNDSKSNFTRMPSYLEKYTTEFNYLFSEIYKFQKQSSERYSDKVYHDYTTHYNLPNNIRKFL